LLEKHNLGRPDRRHSRVSARRQIGSILVRRGIPFRDFAARRLMPPIVISAVLLLLKALASAQSLRTQATQPLPPSPSPSPSPTLTLTFNPQMPSVQDTVPIGTVIATQSDGSPFADAGVWAALCR
jgi:hypothetical protein